MVNGVNNRASASHCSLQSPVRIYLCIRYLQVPYFPTIADIMGWLLQTLPIPNKQQPEKYEGLQTESTWLDPSTRPRRPCLTQEGDSILANQHEIDTDTDTPRNHREIKKRSLSRRWFFDDQDGPTVTTVKDRSTLAPDVIASADLMKNVSPVILPTRPSILPVSGPTITSIWEPDFEGHQPFPEDVSAPTARQLRPPSSSTLGVENHSNTQELDGVGTSSGVVDGSEGETMNAAKTPVPPSSATQAVGAALEHNPISSTILSNGKGLSIQGMESPSKSVSLKTEVEQVTRSKTSPMIWVILLLLLILGIVLAITFRKGRYRIAFRPLRVFKVPQRGAERSGGLGKSEKYHEYDHASSESKNVKEIEKKPSAAVLAMTHKHETFNSTMAELGRHPLLDDKHSSEKSLTLRSISDRLRKFMSFKPSNKPVNSVVVFPRSSNNSLPNPREPNSPSLPSSFFKVPDPVLRKSHRGETDMKWIERNDFKPRVSQVLLLGMSPLKNSPMAHDLQHLRRDTVELHRINTDDIQTIYHV